MKSKKVSLNNKPKEFNFSKNSKWFWIASVVLFIAGLFVTIFAGFNLGIEYTGGTVLSVNLGEQISTTSKYNKVVNDITDLLHDNGLYLASEPQKQGEADNAVLVLTYKNKSSLSKEEMTTLNNAIRTQINQKYNAKLFDQLDDDYDITSNSGYISDSSIKNGLLFNAIVAILFALAIILIYIAIRFGALTSLTSILGVVHDTIITLVLVSIFRINVSSSIFGAVATVGAFSIINSLIIFGRIKENLNNPTLTDKSNAEIVNMSVKQSLTKVIFTTSIMLVASLMFIIIATSAVREFVGVVLIGTVISLYSTLFLLPGFWANVNHKRDLSKPKTQTVEIEQSTNDNDIEAEVVEVNTDKGE